MVFEPMRVDRLLQLRRVSSTSAERVERQAERLDSTDTPDESHRSSQAAARRGGRHRAAATGEVEVVSSAAMKSWTYRMLAEPSPTPEATRLTAPCRASPTAKTPGMDVSMGRIGCTSSDDWRSGPVST